MERVILNGNWTAFGGSMSDIRAQVPGCIHTDLLDNKLIENPYYRDNETGQMWIGETDWTYERTFQVSPEFLTHKNVKLVCYGLDTFAHITINGKEIASTDNAFRTWEFDAKPYLFEGENKISIKFLSTYPYMKEKIDERWLTITGMNHHRVTGSNYVRKSQCNYGWDWGPMCVTAGIWRPIELQAYDEAKIDDVHIRQTHNKSSVTLDVHTTLKDYSRAKLKAKVTVSFQGETVCEKEYDIAGEISSVKIDVENPKLWWPNNLGEQNLYDVSVELMSIEGDTIDESSTRIGLRTLILDRHDDEWGESFQFKVNGVPFFAKGANWIPIDTFVTRAEDDFYRQILTDAQEANMNFIRVWGGGIYEQDILYDLCDELGLCIWQDFMFACSAYPVYDDAWLNTFKAEAADNIKRLRSHASMALWCGNNELEHMMYLITDEVDEQAGTISWAEYKLLFEEVIPEALAKYDGEHDYWVSSSHTPGENRGEPNDPTRGDAHLWEVWHGREPFEWYRTCEHRFNSEFGFQSFPEPEVVKSYTLPEDRNITSFIMEKHQRSGIGNDAILQYMLSWFQLPTSFDMLMWASQILQSLAIKYAVEHWRRKMPQGMGTLYWQLNDCWPVASWSSIDYIGNWKALHFSAKRFFAPVLISGVEDKDNITVEIHISNDTLKQQKGKVEWKLVNLSGDVETGGQFDAIVAANTSAKVYTLDIADAVKDAGGTREVVLFYSFIVDGEQISSNTTYFERPKHMKLQSPKYETSAKKLGVNEFELTLKADKPALWVWPDLDGITAKYSDRFFDLDGENESIISVTTQEDMDESEFNEKLKIWSITDTYAQ